MDERVAANRATGTTASRSDRALARFYDVDGLARPAEPGPRPEELEVARRPCRRAVARRAAVPLRAWTHCSSRAPVRERGRRRLLPTLADRRRRGDLARAGRAGDDSGEVRLRRRHGGTAAARRRAVRRRLRRAWARCAGSPSIDAWAEAAAGVPRLVSGHPLPASTSHPLARLPRRRRRARSLASYFEEPDAQRRRLRVHLHRRDERLAHTTHLRVAARARRGSCSGALSDQRARDAPASRSTTGRCSDQFPWLHGGPRRAAGTIPAGRPRVPLSHDRRGRGHVVAAAPRFTRAEQPRVRARAAGRLPSMFLKRLHIKGFKSFADPTTLEFEPGVTVVVGPNGSGKSNVVDAVTWVLGAQGPRALRSQKMEDVIFAGTASRAALGRAEVSLTIDNASGQAPGRPRRGHDHEDAVPQRRVRVRDQRRAVPAARHPRAAERLGRRPPAPHDHRAGPARPGAQRAARGASQRHRGGRGRPQAPPPQGARRAPPRRDPGEPRAARRPRARGAPPDAPARAPGRRGALARRARRRARRGAPLPLRPGARGAHRARAPSSRRAARPRGRRARAAPAHADPRRPGLVGRRRAVEPARGGARRGARRAAGPAGPRPRHARRARRATSRRRGRARRVGRRERRRVARGRRRQARERARGRGDAPQGTRRRALRAARRRGRARRAQRREFEATWGTGDADDAVARLRPRRVDRRVLLERAIDGDGRRRTPGSSSSATAPRSGSTSSSRAAGDAVAALSEAEALRDRLDAEVVGATEARRAAPHRRARRRGRVARAPGRRDAQPGARRGARPRARRPHRRGRARRDRRPRRACSARSSTSSTSTPATSSPSRPRSAPRWPRSSSTPGRRRAARSSGSRREGAAGLVLPALVRRRPRVVVARGATPLRDVVRPRDDVVDDVAARARPTARDRLLRRRASTPPSTSPSRVPTSSSSRPRATGSRRAAGAPRRATPVVTRAAVEAAFERAALDAAAAVTAEAALRAAREALEVARAARRRGDATRSSRARAACSSTASQLSRLEAERLWCDEELGEIDARCSTRPRADTTRDDGRPRRRRRRAARPRGRRGARCRAQRLGGRGARRRSRRSRPR